MPRFQAAYQRGFPELLLHFKGADLSLSLKLAHFGGRVLPRGQTLEKQMDPGSPPPRVLAVGT